MVGSPNFLKINLSEASKFETKNTLSHQANVFIFRQLTLEPIEPVLLAAASICGVNLSIKFGAYDTWRQELSNSPDEFMAYNCIFVFPDYWRILDKLTTDCEELTSFSEMAADLMLDLVGFLDNLRNTTTAKLVLLTPDLNEIVSSLWGVDRIKAKGWFNDYLSKLSQDIENMNIISLDGVFSNLGQPSLFQMERYFHYKLPFPEGVLNALASEMLISIRQSIGAQKKVIALDCDNTLWNGICGDIEKFEELEVGTDSLSGHFHFKLQQTIKQLRRSGVLVVLLSKNDETNVFEVFDNHRGMVLQRQDIAGWRIDWNRKSDNIRELAEELNLSLDSFLFVDDSPQEISEMTTFCPEVFSLHLDQENLRRFPEIIRRLGFFEKNEITDSDRMRTGHFIAEKKRKKVKNSVSNYQDYLDSLGIKLKLRIRGEVNLNRIEQLAARTNQMNLNCWRASKIELQALNEDENSYLLSAELTDKFGDLGIIGCIAVTFEKQRATIRLFVLSCRAFGRSVEHAMVGFVEEFASKSGCRDITAVKVENPKNGMIDNFFQALNYTKSDNTGESVFEKVLSDKSSSYHTYPSHLNIQLPAQISR